jgi:hypothetical protein
MGQVLSVLESKGLVGELIRALRQGFFFGLETRVPYAVAGILRPSLFGKESRPFKGQLAFFAQQTLQHGWIIARISFLFKLFRAVLAKVFAREDEWHTFVAGAIAGYLVMVRDAGDPTLKTQINMAIGIRTIYAVGSYLVRKGMVPIVSHTAEGYAKASALYVSLMWGAVMWHWKHQARAAPGEMNRAQVQQMDFIYTHGDAPGAEKWLGNNYLLWGAACLAASRLLK